MTRFAFAGFRHAHIRDLLAGVEEREDCEVVACCEEDRATREQLRAEARIAVTHENYAQMLAEISCDVVAIGDVYARRGAMVIAALEAGRHVLSDKPLCTSLAEQEVIERLARERSLQVGLQLDCRDAGAFRTLRDLLRAGAIGEVVTVRIDGQHPLLLGKRPAWYFEPGQHGGTINDIGIHAFDFVPWLTGLKWGAQIAARTWNAKARDFPHFQDSAQMFATLENGAGVFADFSYLAPDQLGYTLPDYWKLVVHGTRGRAETHLLADEVTILTDRSTAPERHRAKPKRLRGYLADFLAELRGEPAELTSADCLSASRRALEAQAAALTS